MNNISNIELEYSLMPAVCFATQQNNIPFIRKVVIKNNSNESLKDISFGISFEPCFAQEFSVNITEIAPGSSVDVTPQRVILSTDFLFSVTEAMFGRVKFFISQGDEIIYSQDDTINILSYDQWLGTSVMPELTASFVTPNYPKISQILADASQFLNKWCSSPALTAYQTNNQNTARMQMAAIYSAIASLNIAYCMPPASFENIGQKIRMADTITEQKMGTCIDMAILFASALEAARLHPILIFTENHAFCGCWLENQTFPESVIYDKFPITKRAVEGINEICLVECTCMCAKEDVDFDTASKKAFEKLRDCEDFELAIDIARCRSSKILPLPLRINENGVFKAADYGKTSKDALSAPKEISAITENALADEEITKQVIWERKLLDLNLRNPLLNFRASGCAVQLLTPDLSLLENKVTEGKSFKLLARPDEVTIENPDAKIFDVKDQRDVLDAIAQREFENERLRTFFTETELEKNLKKLHRTAKVSIEENGANTLYMAIGFLKWYESDKSEKARLAPLVLLPVDITRKLVDKTYTVKMRDEDAQINITLLEMLRQDFGISIKGLNPPPMDESGVDLALIFSTIRQAVMSKARWEIEEYAFIGQFSFSRFIMWNDIKNRSEELRQNKTVASLISGKLEWDTPDLSMSTEEIDSELRPSDMAIPMSVDSSQLAAVFQAAKGESFVLHGPPGTGKSQTITNMIANALYQGKTVLFVAEKMAALEVVQKRLSKLSLSPFSLEIHSNKAQKRAVLKQLENTLNTAHVKSPEEHTATAQKLFETRKALNDVMLSLHKEQSHSMSLFEIISRYEQLKEFDGKLTIDRELTHCTAEEFDAMCEAVHNAAVCAQSFGDISNTSLSCYKNKNYSFEIRDSFSTLAKEYEDVVESLSGAIKRLNEKFGYSAIRYEDIKIIAQSAKAAYSSNALITPIVAAPQFDTLKPQVDKLIEDVNALSSLKATLDKEFDSAVYSFDAQKAYLEYKSALQKWAIPRALGVSKSVKGLMLYAKSVEITKTNITEYYDKLINYQNLSNAVKNADMSITALLAGVWAGEQTNVSLLNSAYSASALLREDLSKLSGDLMQKNAILSAICSLAVNKSGDDAVVLVTLSGAFDKLCATEEKLRALSVDLDMLHNADNFVENATAISQGWQNEVSLLREWTAFYVSTTNLNANGLVEVTRNLLSGELLPQDASNAFICAFCKTAAGDIISSTPALSAFTGDSFDDTISKYNDTIAEYERLTIQELVAKLSANIPSASAGFAASSEVAILQKAIKSGGRMLPIRKLFDSIPNLLRKICPCMLMSPISVAQYIDPTFPKFDLVIFDEASQMPTCEAVGSIARGENVIIVGDPKQLPPTSFFMTNHFDEENSDKEDLESVLDDCLALMMPSRHLLWHYRSRHESLIAYSNSAFYENKLLTFPSPDDLISNVSMVMCEGYYDRSSTKQNKNEAQAVVNEIIRRLRDEELRKQSIGVVTFSIVQQHLIDDMLTDALAADPELEALADSMYEPIFIKNLENVQGDERDVILFSVGYGPDKNGKVSMNFGPINKDGGWRRLNVAITRSRKQMIVFSTIRPEQIDLSRTASEGVAGLKGFLEFAARGKSALNLPAPKAVTQNDKFIELIAKEIETLGYKTKCNIGTSEYRIDIGIVNPENEGTYILGIMCDSKDHVLASTARDRHILQPSVLRGLGWNILHIYSLDWLDDKQKVLAKISKAITDAIENKNQIVEEKKAEPIVFETIKESKVEYKFTEYKEYEPKNLGTSEDFHKDGAQKKIVSILEKTIEKEAPISQKLLFKRVLSAYGMTRGGSKVNEAITSALDSMPVMMTRSSYNTFCWQQNQVPGEYADFRVPSENSEKRLLEDIPPQEISNCIEFLLKAQYGMTRQDLVREVAKIFGYSRTSANIDSIVEEGIESALFKGFAKEENGKIVYVTK